MAKLSMFFYNILTMYRQTIILVLLFFAAFFWHSWYGLSHFNFQQDVARDILITRQWYQEGRILIAYGPKTSIGNFYLPPLYYQLCLTLAYLFPNASFAMFWLTILVESFTPILIFLILKSLFDENKALIASSLYIVCIYPMLFGSFAWNPNMIPFLTTAMLYLLLRYYQEKKRHFLSLATICVAIACNFHYQSVMLLPFIATFCVVSIYKDRQTLWYWVLGIVVSALTLVGYVVGEYHSDFQNTHTILNYFTGEHRAIYERVSKPAFVLNFLPDFIERVMTGDTRYFGYISIGRILFLIGVPIMTWMAWARRKKDIRHFIILCFFVSLFIMLRVYRGDKLDYYMSPLFILPVFLVAYLLEFHKIFKVLIIAIAFYIAQFLIKTPKVDQYLDLQIASQQIHAMQKDTDARFYFYDETFVNVFAFGLQKFTDIKINQNDSDIIEVCKVSEVCIFDGTPQCKHSREYTIMARLKWEAGYVPEYIYTTEQFQIVKGKLINASLSPENFYKHNPEVGTDKLLPELYL